MLLGIYIIILSLSKNGFVEKQHAVFFRKVTKAIFK